MENSEAYLLASRYWRLVRKNIECAVNTTSHPVLLSPHDEDKIDDETCSNLSAKTRMSRVIA